MPHADFVHLRARSAYSLSEGAIKVGALVELAKRERMPALALTDLSNVFGLVNLFERQPCPRVENFVACVVTGNNGAFIPISTANDAEVSAALSRIVDAVAGAASEFSITRPPISSTLRVRVDETLVPRSRADGFDYDANANTIVFRGGTYRPRRGQTVRSAYFFWR